MFTGIAHRLGDEEIMVDRSLKKQLKDVRWVHRLWYRYKRHQHNKLIENEQKEYEQRALQMGISSKEEPAERTYQRLKDRLAARGIVWPPEPQGRPLHVVFCTNDSPALEQANIPPEIARVGRVSNYFADERMGKPCTNPWETRQFVDSDLPQFIKRINRDTPVDMLLSYLSGSSISASTIREINEMGIPTFFFHLDDRLYFRGQRIADPWSGPADVCSAYDLNLTNAPISMVKYWVEGGIALFWPQAANRDVCRPLGLPFSFDVSFIGTKYGRRSLLIERLQKEGIRVECFGPGWENGPLTDTEMIEVYSRSRINLGFGYVGYSSYQCIKGRDLEVPMCGALYLTSHNNDLNRLYTIGEEIETYHDDKDCLRKIRALLADPDRCAMIREAARKACLERHTREIRVRALLECKPSVPWADQSVKPLLKTEAADETTNSH